MGGVHLTSAVCTAHRCSPIPQTGHGLAPQRVRYGLGHLRLHPVQVVQRPRVLEQSPHFPPFLAAELADRVASLSLSPRSIIQLPIGAPQGNGRLDAVHRRFGL